MTEAQQLAQVVELCERAGVLWHHCRDSRGCDGPAGVPDLVLVGPAGVAWRELKSDPHSMTRDQTRWAWTLRAAGANVGLWLPSHGRSGVVEADIAALGSWKG